MLPSALMIRIHILAFAIVCVTVSACAREQAPTYDLVIANGRVMDPESRSTRCATSASGTGGSTVDLGVAARGRRG